VSDLPFLNVEGIDCPVSITTLETTSGQRHPPKVDAPRNAT